MSTDHELSSQERNEFERQITDAIRASLVDFELFAPTLLETWRQAFSTLRQDDLRNTDQSQAS